jgi:geranylgeranyl diphosphate synthase type II
VSRVYGIASTKGYEVEPNELITAKKSIFDDYLFSYFKEQGLDSGIFEAFSYSLKAGGKRIRPVLTMLACETAGGDCGDALAAGLAIEMIHTFSLIHDDLPALDNDELRRGLPTCHKKYGEATAILAGDALIFQALSVICSSAYPVDVKLDICRTMAEVCGTKGLVQGEYDDIMAEHLDLPLKRIEEIYIRKTSRLFELCMFSGARIATGDQSVIQPLVMFGTNIGLAFQAIDDILDVTSSAEKLGKSLGKDIAQDKATIVKALGIEAARAWAQDATNKAIHHLGRLPGKKSGPLRELALWMMGRVM